MSKLELHCLPVAGYFQYDELPLKNVFFSLVLSADGNWKLQYIEFKISVRLSEGLFF